MAQNNQQKFKIIGKPKFKLNKIATKFGYMIDIIEFSEDFNPSIGQLWLKDGWCLDDKTHVTCFDSYKDLITILNSEVIKED